MDEMITTDGQTIAVAGNLPNGEVGVSHLCTGSNRGCTSVDGVHAVSSHIVRQTAGAADTRNHCNIFGGYANLGHSLMERCQEEMVTATRTPTRLSFLEIICCIAHNCLLL